MGWRIIYDKSELHETEGLYNIIHDVDINKEYGSPVLGFCGDNEDEIILDAVAFIRELCGLNALESGYQDGKLSIYDSIDNKPFQIYHNFRAYKVYSLIDSTGRTFESTVPGTFGGHKKLKIYGRLNCPSALRHIEKGEYVKYRVFFPDEKTAIEAGYRPCAICMKEAYKEWREKRL